MTRGRARWRDVMDEPEPRYDQEIPAPDWVFTSTESAQPTSELEALMMSTPGHDVEYVPESGGDPYSFLEKDTGVSFDLTDLERQVLDAVCISGLTVREAADVLGISKSTVDRVKNSALARIRARINQHEWYGDSEEPF